MPPSWLYSQHTNQPSTGNGDILMKPFKLYIHIAILFIYYYCCLLDVYKRKGNPNMLQQFLWNEHLPFIKLIS